MERSQAGSHCICHDAFFNTEIAYENNFILWHLKQREKGFLVYQATNQKNQAALIFLII